MTRASDLGDISTRLQRIAKLAREDPKRVLTNLAYYIDVAFLREAYRQTRKDGAVGVDGQTAADYARNLGDNLRSLLERFRSGRYRAPPVRRHYIPKGDGSKTRPIGIPTFEDKVLQKAVAMVLTAVYEQDFLNCSYGFRPGRSAHQALANLWQGSMSLGGGSSGSLITTQRDRIRASVRKCRRQWRVARRAKLQTDGASMWRDLRFSLARFSAVYITSTGWLRPESWGAR